MCRIALAEFACDVASPGAARRWVTEQIGAWHLYDLVDIAALLTSELVSNAVVHASSGPLVEASVGAGVFEVGVSDFVPRLIPGRTGDVQGVTDDLVALAETGRGLLMVEALADEWGASSLATGKEVWFRLQVPESSQSDHCRCTDPSAPLVPLKSGRHVHHRPEAN